MKSQRKKYLTAAQAADLLMVSPVTVRKWAQRGALPSQSTLGGHRRFVVEDLRRFAQEHGIRVPDDSEINRNAEAKRILLVDDDAIFAEYLREIVLAAEPGAQVECAADGFEAGQLSETLRPQLLVIDVNMPGIDGIELCRRLRTNPNTVDARIVVMSGQMSTENAAAARAAGADACLGKGAKRAEILTALALSRTR
jgi:excisionase family DNA binding protein